MINRPTDIFPAPIVEETLRLYKLNKNWIKIVHSGEDKYQTITVEKTWLTRLMEVGGTGADVFGMFGVSHWLGQGPKIARPTREQCEALRHVELRVDLTEFTSPFPAMLVELPEVMFHPFQAVLVHHWKEFDFLTCQLVSSTHEYDIVTTIGQRGRPIEESISKYDDDVASDIESAHGADRVALNLCLALSHFGSMANYLLPKEVESDKRLAREHTERGERARKRLELQPQLVSFSREVELYKKQTTKHKAGELTGTEVSSHWRRGHWAMQPYGPKSSLRKRIFRAPILVRGDKFVGDVANTTTVYK